MAGRDGTEDGPEGSPHLGAAVADADHDLAHPGVTQPVEEVGEKRAPTDRRQHLRSVADGGAEARTETAGEDDRRRFAERRHAFLKAERLSMPYPLRSSAMPSSSERAASNPA